MRKSFSFGNYANQTARVLEYNENVAINRINKYLESESAKESSGWNPTKTASLLKGDVSFMKNEEERLPLNAGGIILRKMMNIKKAGKDVEDIDYVNAHGTSTIKGDQIELNAIMRLFDKHKNLFVSSTKSSIGHLLGAAGSVESIFSILAINNSVAPGTLNLEDPIESNNINLVAKVPIETKINIALSNSFGFGGTNTALLFKSI